jgi:hypothetical protein
MSGKRSKPKNASWWSAQIGAWERSGLTQADFCRARGLSISSFSNWRSKLLKEERHENPTEAALVRKHPTAAKFITVDIPVTPAPLVRVSVGSVTVDFDTLPPPAWVAELASFGGR